jgi:hypothetical protein
MAVVVISAARTVHTGSASPGIRRQMRRAADAPPSPCADGGGAGAWS